MAEARAVRRKPKINIYPYLFIAPFFIIFAVFSAFPTVYSLVVSFFDWNGFDAMKPVGFQNYTGLLSDPVFLKSVLNTFGILCIVLPLEVILGLFFASILNNVFSKNKHYFQTVLFMPYITSPVATSIMFGLIFSYKYGLLNWALKGLGLITGDVNWLGNPKYSLWVISIVYLWRCVGYTIVLLIAGMQTISPDIYESSTIDGAGPFTTFFRITLPLLKPVLVFVIITTIIGDLQIFEEPFLLFQSSGGSGTDNSAVTMVTYLYQSAFHFGRSGYGAAISYVLFLIILVFSVFMYKVMLRREDNE